MDERKSICDFSFGSCICVHNIIIYIPLPSILTILCMYIKLYFRFSLRFVKQISIQTDILSSHRHHKISVMDMNNDSQNVEYIHL